VRRRVGAAATARSPNRLLQWMSRLAFQFGVSNSNLKNAEKLGITKRKNESIDSRVSANSP
jgi:hypothetical protein